uniref:Uroporphyrinogen decarboxylase 1ic isoform X2 n=1 Tax=Rhizophora mucronata TaxID=61149 RepID=A0A2P2L516_RHIMU
MVSLLGHLKKLLHISLKSLEA